MTHDPDQRTAEDIRRDIAATREELGDTVAALAEKADVKKQVKGRVDEVKSDVREKVDHVKEKIPGVHAHATPNGQPETPSLAHADPTAGAQAAEPPYRDPKVIGAALAAGIIALWLIRRRR